MINNLSTNIGISLLALTNSTSQQPSLAHGKIAAEN